MECDKCGLPAIFTVTAIYLTDASESSRQFSAYSTPMIKSCFTHLAEQVHRYACQPFANCDFLIRVIKSMPF